MDLFDKRGGLWERSFAKAQAYSVYMAASPAAHQQRAAHQRDDDRHVLAEQASARIRHSITRAKYAPGAGLLSMIPLNR